ncbi:MAG TPA: DMT family transporter [Pilimelia sp.]|nr:DMT family transporter [Pilimelia sp.]
MKSLNPTGTALCVLGMTILGSSVAVSRLILDYPAMTGQAMRYALAAVALAALLRVTRRAAIAGRPDGPAGPHDAARRRPGGRDLVLLAALAAVGLVAFNLLLLSALRHADAAIVGTVVGAAPLGLALLGPLQRRARPATRLVSGAAVVVAGTALVHGGGDTDLIGMLAAVGALAGEVAFSLLAAAVLPRLGAVRVSAWSCALAVPMLLLAAVLAGEPSRWRLPTAPEAWTLAYLALMLTVGAFLAWFTGLRLLGVERAGMFVGLLPVTTLITASVQDARLPAAAQAAGVLVVALGLAVGLTHRQRPDPVRLARTARPSPSGLASPEREVAMTNVTR